MSGIFIADALPPNFMKYQPGREPAGTKAYERHVPPGGSGTVIRNRCTVGSM
jgi:hypothetical protein